MFKQVKQKALAFLKQGISPAKLALTVAIGLFFGTIPIIGATSVLCAAAAIRLRLNMAVIQAVNYACYPLQLLLFVPFIKAGIALFGDGSFNYTVTQIIRMIKTDTWSTIKQLFEANLLGVLVWAISMPLVCWGICVLCRHAFNRLERSRV